MSFSVKPGEHYCLFPSTGDVHCVVCFLLSCGGIGGEPLALCRLQIILKQEVKIAGKMLASGREVEGGVVRTTL
jgi:hypothetical protein